MSKPVGGRGKKAPYETCTIRIPKPLLSEIEQRVEDYRAAILNPGPDLDPEVRGYPIPLEEAKEAARKVLRSKKKRLTMFANLLQVIYGSKVTEDELVKEMG